MNTYNFCFLSVLLITSRHSKYTLADVDLTFLHKLQHNINNNSTLKVSDAGDQLTTASSIFLRGFWKPIIGDLPILILGHSYHTDRLGNFMGTFFDALACARIAGLHYIGIKVNYVGHQKDKRELFFDALPIIYENPNPSAPQLAAELVKKRCNCDRYCWWRTDPWEYQLPMISSIVRKGLYLHLSMRDEYGATPDFKGLQLLEKDIVANMTKIKELPFYPDVAIHYRFSDNVFGGMGLLSIGTLIDRIPRDAKYIYLFTDSPGRLQRTPYAESCTTVLQGIFDDLQHAFPDATVVIKRGGNEITIWCQFAFANITICSPSTFCLWPSLAREGLTYMAATDYVGAYRGSAKGHIPLHKNWFWIQKPNIYNNFTKTSTAQDILDTIRMDIPAWARVGSPSSRTSSSLS